MVLKYPHPSHGTISYHQRYSKLTCPERYLKKPLLPTGPFISLTTSAMHQAHSAVTKTILLSAYFKNAYIWPFQQMWVLWSHLISQHLAKYLVTKQVLTESSENKSPWMLLPTDQILAPNSCAHFCHGRWPVLLPGSLGFFPGWCLDDHSTRMEFSRLDYPVSDVWASALMILWAGSLRSMDFMGCIYSSGICTVMSAENIYLISGRILTTIIS